MLTELEKYLIEDKCKADKEFISNGVVLVKKDCLYKKHLRTIKTQDYPLSDECGINHFDGEIYELPEEVKLKPHDTLAFELNENFGIDYKLVKMFYDHFAGDELHFTKTLIDGDISYPALKVFRKIFYGTENQYGPDYQISWEYVGLIAGIKFRNNEVYHDN